MVNLSDIFRTIFWPPKEQLGTNDLPRDIQEDLENRYGRRPNLHWQSEPSTSHEQWRMFTEGQHPEQGDHDDYFQFGEGDFLQEFEQMFQNMFRGFSFNFNPPTQGLPSFDLPPDLSSEIPQENFGGDSGSLRDRMLKGPDSSLDNNFEDQQNGSQSEDSPLFPPFSLFGDLWRFPFGGLSCPDQRVDRDLDSEVNMGTHSLDDILAHKDDSQTPQQVPRFSSSSSSFSSVTVVDSNGVTEKRTTRRDSSGREEVVITRRIGDQTQTVIHRKDNCGNEETQVDSVSSDTGGNASSQQLTPLSSIYESVIEQFFPKRR